MSRPVRAALLGVAVWVTVSVPGGDANAQDVAREAAAFVQAFGDDALRIAADKALTASERQRRLKARFVESFDVPAIGRFVLGRYWAAATPSERAEFLTLFEEMTVKVYNGRFAHEQIAAFVVNNSRSQNTGGALVATTVSFSSAKEPIKVEWRVERAPRTLKIVDVIAEGVSLSLAQRDEFGSVLRRNGGHIDALLDAMRETIKRQQLSGN
jgi:phospholipid transport system substrate-binding protein